VLNLYRRHRRACKTGHKHNLCSGEFDERKKGWKRCDCPIFASGTLNDRFGRKSTDGWDWDEARKIAGRWESENTGTDAAEPVPVPSPAPAPTVAPEVKISAAISKFLAEHKGGSARGTTRMHG
jgi:hypothetical protein